MTFNIFKCILLIFTFTCFAAPAYSAQYVLDFLFDPDASSEAEMYSFATVNFPSFDRTKNTFVLIHGFTGGRNTLNEIRSALVQNSSTDNIITVDWSSMSGADRNDSASYNWVYNRMWHVGRNLATELENLNVDPAKTTLVGYSLGAHIAGTTGHRYHKNTNAKFRRIVGLDAAGVYMTHLGGDVRLDKGDATKVIGIHSSEAAHFPATSEGKGWGKEYGDLDIYIYTKTVADDQSGQLLGSGHGNWRNKHDYANKVYRDLVKGNSYTFANKWTWGEGDFKGAFTRQSLGSQTGTVTIWHK